MAQSTCTCTRLADVACIRSVFDHLYISLTSDLLYSLRRGAFDCFPPQNLTSKNILTIKNHSKGIYLDHDTAAAHHLAGFALTVNFAQTNPLTELLVVVNL